MNIEELIDRLKIISRHQNAKDGYEEDHFNADALLLDYINDQRVVDAFNSIKKWYS